MRLSNKSYSAVTAKQSFGRIVDEAQHSPITITKHSRDVAVIISAEKLKRLSQSVLSDYFREAVENGDMTFFEALDRQSEIEKKVTHALEQHECGQTKVADDNFFNAIKEKALARAK